MSTAPKGASIRKAGKVTAEATATDRKTGEELARISRAKVVPEPPLKEGQVIAYIHAYYPVKITKKFQSVGVEVGVDFPFAVTPGDIDVIPDLITQALNKVEEVVPELCSELQETLDGLVAAVK